MTEVGTNLQPHLGKIVDNRKPSNNMGGIFTVAKVTKVHHQQGTVDLRIVKNGDLITSSMDNRGKFGARVATVSAHWNEGLMSSSGVVEPIQEDQLVIVGFLDGYRTQPFIVGSFHQTWKDYQNILTEDYPLLPNKFFEDKREALKYLRVTPSQMYHKIDGIGAIEMSLPSKTFLKIDPDINSVIDDSHEGFDHDDLSEKDPVTHETRTGKTDESLFPVKVLFSHRTSYNDPDSTYTKFFIDTDGTTRITRDNNDGTLTFQEYLDSGSVKIRRQLDSVVHGEGSNFVEVNITKDGAVQLQKNLKGISSIEIDKDNSIQLKHRSGSYIKMTSDGDIIIDAKRHLITLQRDEEVDLS